MQRIFIFLCSLSACIIFMNTLTAIAPKDRLEVENNLCVLELLPNLLCPLAVDPVIPSDFIALSPQGTLNLYDWIYWGPKDVLEAYFKNSTSLKSPILRVKLSANVAQNGPNSFSSEESLKMYEKQNPKGFASVKTQWGDYPILAVQTQTESKLIFMAWVGLNDPEAGWTLMFNLVYPDEKDHPNNEDRKLWENLINNTTQLTDGNYFKACGQDLQEGFTLVTVGGTKLKMLAEKRQSDGTMQVVVIPESSDVKFFYVDMMECAMGAKWKFGEPMVKVYGNIVVNNKDIKITTTNVTSIFFKTVPEFSFKKNDEKSFIFQKICDKMD